MKCNLQAARAGDEVHQPLTSTKAWWQRVHGNPLFRRTVVTTQGLVEPRLTGKAKEEDAIEGTDAAGLEVAATRWGLYMASAVGNDAEETSKDMTPGQLQELKNALRQV